MDNEKIALKYLSELSIKPKTQNNNFINISCPICGEGNSSKWKARGYVLLDNNLSYYCHNQCGGMSFHKFLQTQDSHIASNFLKEMKKIKLKDEIDNSQSEEINKFYNIKKDIHSNEILDSSENKMKGFFKTRFDKATYNKTINNEIKTIDYDIEDLNDESIEYLESRGFTEIDYESFKYCPEKESIIIPIWYRRCHNEIYGFQARSIKNKVFHNQNFKNPKITNLEYVLSLPKGSNVYLFEAEFDRISTNIKNSCAVLGKTISDEIESLLKGYNLIFCHDADKDGDLASIKQAKLKREVLIHEEGMYSFKDFNKLLELGQTKEDITNYILDNIRKPNRALMEMKKKGYSV